MGNAVLQCLKKIIHAKSFWCVFVRWVLYVLLTLTVLMLEYYTLPHLTLWGAHGMLLYGLICGVGYFEGEKSGALFGALTGIFASLFLHHTLFYLPLSLLLTGYFCGVYSQAVFRHRYLTWLLGLLAALSAEGLCTALSLTLRWLTFAPAVCLRTVAGELLLSLLFCQILYPLQKCIARIRTEKPTY